MRYSVWIYCCKRPNYDLCILQGSVARVLRWGGLNWSHVRQVLWCCLPKSIKIGQCFTALFKKNKNGTFLLKHGVVNKYCKRANGHDKNDGHENDGPSKLQNWSANFMSCNFISGIFSQPFQIFHWYWHRIVFK